jgi:hypothetical protein
LRCLIFMLKSLMESGFLGCRLRHLWLGSYNQIRTSWRFHLALSLLCHSTAENTKYILNVSYLALWRIVSDGFLIEW